jgi:class 3 adenylate cyclase/HAMP domain-containing protein
MSSKTNGIIVEKRDSIKNRLQRVFITISISIVFLMTVFSLVYFYFFIRREAVNQMRNKIHLVDVFMEQKKSETSKFAESIARDRPINIGIDLGSSIKLTEYLMPWIEKDRSYYITIFDRDGNTLVDIGLGDSPVFIGRNTLTPSEEMTLRESLKDKEVSDTINIENGLQESFPAFIAAYPIKRNNGEINGVVMVRFIFSDNIGFFNQISNNTASDIAVYVNAKPVVSTADINVTPERYNNALFMKKNTEIISFTGLGLNEYRGLYKNSGEPIALLHMHMSSFSYVAALVVAFIIYVIFMLVAILAISLIVIKISAGILNPIDTLLDGVNIVRSGNLTYEIFLSLNDEIGRLGVAFNEMRIQLMDKIFTIESMNRDLEQKVEDRTATINTLNDKMKHYLSPQLYSSIVGGERDVSLDKHYRKKLTIFFSDIVNFTSITENMEPEDLSNLLNTYLDNRAVIAEKHNGTIDKFVGDAVMVFFGDPVFTSDKDHAIRAVKMAMDMQKRLGELRLEWADKGVVSLFHARMGINTGFCTVGNFGSETKMDYTIIGNNVNLAARYENVCIPDSILISYETYMLVRDDIDCKLAGEFTLKGIATPVKAYTPVELSKMTVKVKAIEIKDDKELIFRNNALNVEDMPISEKKELLLNIKKAFDTIKKSINPGSST